MKKKNSILFIFVFIFILFSSTSFSYMHNIKYPEARIFGMNRRDISSNMPFGRLYVITNIKLIIEDIVRIGGSEDDILYINLIKNVNPYLHNAIIVDNEEEIEGDIDFYIIPIEGEMKDHGYNVKQYKNNGEKETLTIDFSSINDPNDPIIDYAMSVSTGSYLKHWIDDEGTIYPPENNPLILEVKRDIKITAIFERTCKIIDGWYNVYYRGEKEFRPESSALLQFAFYAKYNETSGFIFVPHGEGEFFAKRFILELTIESYDEIIEPIIVRMFTNRPPVLSF